jgi:hypothetical protein
MLFNITNIISVPIKFPKRINGGNDEAAITVISISFYPKCQHRVLHGKIYKKASHEENFNDKKSNHPQINMLIKKIDEMKTTLRQNSLKDRE